MILEHKTEPIVFYALNRIGSSYINRIGSMHRHPSINWRVSRLTVSTAAMRKDFRLIVSVRHPLQRFWSWFYNFHQDLSSWELVDTIKFYEEFKYTCHYDTHTQFQLYTWKYNYNVLEHLEFIEMEDIPILIENKPRYTNTTNYMDKEVYPFCKKCRLYLESKIIKLYEPDIKWYNSIKKINFEVD